MKQLAYAAVMFVATLNQGMSFVAESMRLIFKTRRQRQITKIMAEKDTEIVELRRQAAQDRPPSAGASTSATSSCKLITRGVLWMPLGLIW